MKCPYCRRTEVCKGAYPEGCFLEQEPIKTKSELPDQITVSLDNIRELQKTHSIVVRRRVNNGNTRPRYRLEESIRFKLSNGITYVIPKGFEWDSSSVPRCLWGILPPAGDFETASLIHDFLYVTKIESRKFADDEMLKWSKAASGTNNKFSLRNLDNQIRYIAVRLFGWCIYYKKRKRQ